MIFNTTAFIKALRERMCSDIITTYYEEAPTKAAFPYAVISDPNISDLAAGDLMLFDVDIWVDEKQPEATEQAEQLCDDLRTQLYNAVITTEGVAAHIGFETRSNQKESEFDLAHRRLSMSARIFYY